MTRKRKLYLIQVCHDSKISTMSAAANGKIIPNLNDIAVMWGIMEELAKACLAEPG